MSTEVPGSGQPDPGMDDPSPDGFVLRMLLGSQLRRLREAAGITPEQAGYEIRASRSKLSRMEAGRVGFKARDAADLLTLYGVTDEQERSRLVVRGGAQALIALSLTPHGRLNHSVNTTGILTVVRVRGADPRNPVVQVWTRLCRFGEASRDEDRSADSIGPHGRRRRVPRWDVGGGDGPHGANEGRGDERGLFHP
jgi:hypothetical protein